jgi:acyl-coenzyme A thioesterase PaaI-like protein
VAPAEGERLIARGRVVKAGRSLTIAQSEVHAERNGARKLVALLTATLVVVQGRAGVSD